MKSTLDVLLSKLRMKQLQLLIAVDDHKSLHKAAGIMAMTQSAASKVLQEVEAMLEAPLFERTKSGMIPNQLGHCVIRYARLLATDLASLCDDIADIRSGRGGRLAIGTIMGAVPDVLVPILNWLHTRQPNLAVEVVEDTSLRMLALLDDGRLDLVIGRSIVSNEPDKYHYQPLLGELISVVVGYAHPPFGKSSLSVADLQDHRWIVYPNNMPLRVLLEREMDQAGLRMPSTYIATASTFVTIAMLQRSHDLVALLPTDVAELFTRHKMLRVLPLELKSKHQSFGVVTRKGGALSPAADQFIQLLRDRNLVH
jgi:DNA-binding transcriptional LysR family regulator